VLRTGFFAVDQWREDGGGDQDDQCGEQCVPATDVVWGRRKMEIKNPITTRRSTLFRGADERKVRTSDTPDRKCRSQGTGTSGSGLRSLRRYTCSQWGTQHILFFVL
jgi:hypothetical protein